MQQNIAAALPRQQKLFGLDHLRALAITMVFVFHYGRFFSHPEWTNTMSDFGWSGVDLFFVLSGYLIASELFREIIRHQSLSLKKFFTKRFFRILPAFYVVLGIYVFVPMAREREALAPLWRYLTFTQNIGLDTRIYGTFSHDWSLCIEEQFYFLLPLILSALLYFKKLHKGYWLLVFFFIAGFAIRLYTYNAVVLPEWNTDDFYADWYTYIYFATQCRLDGLLTGVTIAAIFSFKPKLKETLQQYGNVFLIAGIISLIASGFVCANQESFAATIFGFPLVNISYGLLVIAAISPVTFLYKKSSAITTQIAGISYGLYLSHKIVVHVLQAQLVKLNLDMKSNFVFIISTITCVLAAYALRFIVEKPFLKLRDKVLEHRQ